MKLADQYLVDTFRFDPAVAQQAQLPERPHSLRPRPAARLQRQSLDGCRRLDRTHGRQIQLNPGRPDPKVIGVERGGDQRIELGSKFQLPPPAFHPRGNLVVGAFIVVDGALQQDFCLLLRTLALQTRELVIGKHGGRSRLGFALQSKEPGDFFKRSSCIACGKERRQQNSHRDRE